MIVTCPSCDARYLVDEAKIGPAGRTVKCAKCGHSWMQTPEAADGGTVLPDADLEDLVGSAAGAETGAEAGAEAGEAWEESPPDDGAELSAPDDNPPVQDPPVQEEASFESLMRRASDPANQPEPRRKRRRWPATLAWLLLLAAVVAVVGGAVQFRGAVVAVLPAAEPFYDFVGLSPPKLDESDADTAQPTRPLGVDKVKFDLATVDGAEVLTIEGEIVNPDRVAQDVPDMRVLFLGADGKVIRKWPFPPPVRRIEPGDSVKFTTRMTGPPRDAKRIDVGIEAAPAGAPAR